MKHMSSVLHDANVPPSGVRVLPVGDGVDEAIGKLLLGSQQVRLDKVHHAVICKQTTSLKCWSAYTQLGSTTDLLQTAWLYYWSASHSLALLLIYNHSFKVLLICSKQLGSTTGLLHTAWLYYWSIITASNYYWSAPHSLLGSATDLPSHSFALLQIYNHSFELLLIYSTQLGSTTGLLHTAWHYFWSIITASNYYWSAPHSMVLILIYHHTAWLYYWSDSHSLALLLIWFTQLGSTTDLIHTAWFYYWSIITQLGSATDLLTTAWLYYWSDSDSLALLLVCLPQLGSTTDLIHTAWLSYWSAITQLGSTNDLQSHSLALLLIWSTQLGTTTDLIHTAWLYYWSAITQLDTTTDL